MPKVQSSFTVAQSIMVLALTCSPFVSESLRGQGGSRFFPAKSYMVNVLASPRSTVTSAKMIFNARGPSEYGNTVEGEAAFGTSLPLYLISGSDRNKGLVVGIEGAVFGRFTLTNITKDLISTDWIFAVPFTWHLGEHWVRLRYHHTSAHIGDEYIARFDARIQDYSRDVADLLLFYQASSHLGLYGGGNWAFNVHPNGARRGLLRFGAEVESRKQSRTFLPYGALDVQWEQDNDWEPRMNFQIGVRLPEIRGRRSLRLAMEFLAGPSPQGQFHREHVRHFTLGLYVEP